MQPYRKLICLTGVSVFVRLDYIKVLDKVVILLS